MTPLSHTIEDYLKAIYMLQEETTATTTDIARRMSVSPASATSMMKRLAKMGLVKHQHYQGVTLTKSGKKIALEIVRHHRLLELYLSEIMGLPLDTVHDEAERLEHHISEEFEDRMAELLGHPTHDPHGHPIPTKDGQVSEIIAHPLAEAQPGQAFVIHRVSDADPELLRYLKDLGLMPKVIGEIIEIAPFSGPITLRIGDKQSVVGYEVSKHVFVGSVDD